MKQVIKKEAVLCLGFREGEELTHIAVENGGGDITIYRVSRTNMNMKDIEELLRGDTMVKLASETAEKTSQAKGLKETP